jgi:hypothetical protein
LEEQAITMPRLRVRFYDQPQFCLFGGIASDTDRRRIQLVKYLLDMKEMPHENMRHKSGQFIFTR